MSKEKLTKDLFALFFKSLMFSVLYVKQEKEVDFLD